MAGSGLEDIFESQRSQGCVATGAATIDRQAVWVGVSLGNDLQRSVTAVVNVHNPPVAVQSFSVLSAVAGAAAVIHV
jgi:hypothetical protein